MGRLDHGDSGTVIRSAIFSILIFGEGEAGAGSPIGEICADAFPGCFNFFTKKILDVSSRRFARRELQMEIFFSSSKNINSSGKIYILLLSIKTICT